MRGLFVALIVLLGAFAPPSFANTFSSDQTDLWFNPNEQGWGANIVQQNEILFVTIYVYSATGAPTWFVGPATSYAGSDGAGLHFEGRLYQTTGPYFGGPFNPASVTNREVGTVSFVSPMQEQGRLTYVVDGVTVAKDVKRQTFRSNNLSGVYLGGWVGTYSGCSSSNGYNEAIDTITVSQNANNAFTLQTTNCTYNGTYVQDGRLGRAAGNWSCTNAAAGTFLFIEMEGSLSGMNGRMITNTGTCNFNGRIGGVKRQQ